MINDLDTTIKELLTHEGRLGTSVDISFEIPNREWSGKLSSRPTVNCYLFDIHERRLLREDGWQLEGRGTRDSARRPPPLFFELTYLITAWTEFVDDEHQLLWSVLETLMDNATLPERYLQGDLKDHPWPIHTTVAQLEGVLKSPGEFWTALENHLKPSLSYVVTVGRDRRAERTEAAPVRSTGISLHLPEAAADEGFRLGTIFQLPAGTPLAGLTVEVEGHALRATTDEAGAFTLDGLAPGRYTLIVQIGGQPRRRVVRVRGAAGGSSAYSDVVHDQDGAPLAGVTVEVEELHLRAVTDERGRYSFPLRPGRYTLRFHMDGWDERRALLVRADGYRLRLEYGGRPDDGATNPT